MTAHPHHAKLARVLRRMGDMYRLEDILAKIADGTMQSFVLGDSWLITRIAAFPRRKVLEVIAAVGDKDEILILHDQMIEFAKAEGVGVITAYGRKGWLPSLTDRGWTVRARHFVYAREI
jgi:hypothetical protein